MLVDFCFSIFFFVVQWGWLVCDGDEVLFSLVLLIEGIDLFLVLLQLVEQESLQVLWDSVLGFCLVVVGFCQELEFVGSCCFEQVQCFVDFCLSWFYDMVVDSLVYVWFWVLLCFCFFDQVSECCCSEVVVLLVQVVLFCW